MVAIQKFRRKEVRTRRLAFDTAVDWEVEMPITIIIIIEAEIFELG